MSIELEHAIGCTVSFRGTSHLHPDGKHYVKAVGGVVIVGDLADPHEQVFLQGHDDFITCLAVSNRGHLCATGQQGQEANVILWCLETKRQLFCFEEQDHGIDCLCFTHDDRYLCSCSDIVDQRIIVYDTNTNLIAAWAYINPKPTISIISGGFVRDIKRRDTHEYQFAACGGKQVSMWHLDPVKGELAAHPVVAAGKQTREFTTLAYTPDYEYLLAGTTTGDIAVALMKNRVVQQHIPVCSGGITSMVCLPSYSGIRVVVGGGDGTVTLLGGGEPTDLREEQQIRLDGGLASMSPSRDGSQVMVVSAVGTTFQVRTKDLSFKIHNQVSPGDIYDIAYPSMLSDLFLTCCSDGTVTLWDANDYSARVRCPARDRSFPMSVAGSEDIIVAGCNDGRLMSFDFAQGRPLWQIENAHRGSVTSVKIASNSRFVVSGGDEGELRVWELKTREMAAHLKEHQARITEVRIFPNDMYAISASRDRCLKTWDLRGERRLTQHREKHGGINCLAVASNQTSVITGGQERTLTYWDLRMADPVRVVPLDEEVFSVSIDPSDRYFATAGSGLKVKLWDLNAGMECSVGSGHSRPVQKLSFSPDGKQLVSVGLDHSIMVWNFYT